MEETVLSTIVIDCKREAIKKGLKVWFSTKGDSSLNCDRPVVLSDMTIGKITEIQKPVFKISLDSLPGKMLNMFMPMLSVSRVIYLGRWIWRRIKLSSKSKPDHYHKNNLVSEIK